MTADMTQSRLGYRNNPAILLDMSGSDREIELRENCHAMIVPLSPTSVSDIPGQEVIEALPGSVVFVPAGTTSAVIFRNSFDTLIVLVGRSTPSPQFADEPGFNSPLPDRVLLVTSPQPICAIAQIARRIGGARSSFSPDCIDAVAQLLLSEVMLHVRSRANTADKYRRLLDGQSLRAIDNFLEQHLEDQVSLDDLADHADMTRHQFSRRFKIATGVSPFQYVISKRVKRARELLACGKVSIAEVAYATGFSSQSHLTETFKRHFGVTPGVYRRTQN